MAAPVNTITTANITGIREDLSDIIYDVSPEETPFYTKTKKRSVKNRFTEWQTDALRTAADNAHIEGDDTVADAYTTTTRLGNYTQIFKNAVVASGTEEAVTKAGRAAEMARIVVKIAKEQKLDIELAFFLNQARSASEPRRLAGTGAWIATNDTQLGSGGVSPTGDGTNARTDATQGAFSQTRFDATMQSIWENGGDPDTVYLSPFQMNVALGFVGNNNQRSNITATDERVIKHMAVYVTPWGTVEFMPSRLCRSRDVWIMQDDMWAVGVLRATRNEPLAKTGDNDKRQVLTELTLMCLNEKAHGLVPDNTTS